MRSRSRILNCLPVLSFGLIMTVTIAIGLFIHQISPLRDPTFQRDSANAGSLIPWMRGVSQQQWVLGANVLAGVVAISLTVLFRHYSHIRISRSAAPVKFAIAQILLALFCFVVGIILYVGLMLGFTLYLWLQCIT